MTPDRCLRSFRRHARRLAKDRHAATAVEFALVAPLFLAITFSIFEGGWLMTRTIMQDSAVYKVVRTLRIDGNAAITADQIKKRICEESVVLSDCEASTAVELIALENGRTVPTDAAACMHRGTTAPFEPGQRKELMFVRVCTSVSTITPLMGLAVALPEDGSDNYALVSKAIFVNEPR